MSTAPQNKGPVFEAEPGWGGQLRAWLRGNFWRSLFPLVVIVIIAYIVASLTTGSSSGTSVTKVMIRPTPSTSSTIDVVVIPGDSYTLVARRALSMLVNKSPQRQVTGGQRLYAESELQKTLTSQPLSIGATIHIDGAAAEQALAAYSSQNATQKQRWESLASRISF